MEPRNRKLDSISIEYIILIINIQNGYGMAMNAAYQPDQKTGDRPADVMSADERARAFRNALGKFPTGVAILTAELRDDRRIGMTINSFSSVSIDPPLVLFSVARSAYSLEDLLMATRYGINVLRSDQQGISTRFSKALEDKWFGVPTCIGKNGCVLLRDALAAFECVPYATYDGGDHVIFVVRVVEFDAQDADDPLVFSHGRYAGVVFD